MIEGKGNRTIYFKPAIQYENTGDILINKALLETLRNFGDIVIEDKARPEWFLNEIATEKERLSIYSKEGVEKTLFKNLLKNLFSNQRRYYLVFPPGHTSRNGRGKALKNIRETAKLFLLKFLGCRMVRVGFSIGPFDRWNLLAEKFRSYCCICYAVRDTKSLNLAISSKFNNPIFMPDLAWSFNPSITEPANDSTYTCLLSFRSNVFGTEYNQSYLAPIIEQLIAILKAKSVVDLKIVICYQVLYDREPCRDLFNALKAEFADVEFIDKKLSLLEAVKQYRNADLVISNRLHVLLLAARVESIPLPLVYFEDNKKITSIFEDNEIADLLLNMEAPVNINIEKVKTILSSVDDYREKLKTASHSNAVKISDIISKAFK